MRFVLVGLVLFQVACATSSPRIFSDRVLNEPGYYATNAPESPISEAEFHARLVEAEYILVGESHDSEIDHQHQARIYVALTEGGAKAALGMEMFQRPFQSVLDRFVAGELTEDEFLTQSSYQERWGFPPEYYSPLWTRAQELGLPIVALNVRRELTKRVSAVGLAGLSEAELQDIPEMDLTTKAYRQWLEDIFRAHGMTLEPDRFERFFQAQVLWDETMADTAVNFMRANQGLTHMVIIVGRGHVERGWGVPDRIQRRVPNASMATVVTVPAGTPAQTAAELADFVIVLPKP